MHITMCCIYFVYKHICFILFQVYIITSAYLSIWSKLVQIQVVSGADGLGLAIKDAIWEAAKAGKIAEECPGTQKLMIGWRESFPTVFRNKVLWNQVPQLLPYFFCWLVLSFFLNSVQFSFKYYVKINYTFNFENLGNPRIQETWFWGQVCEEMSLFIFWECQSTSGPGEGEESKKRVTQIPSGSWRTSFKGGLYALSAQRCQIIQAMHFGFQVVSRWRMVCLCHRNPSSGSIRWFHIFLSTQVLNAIAWAVTRSRPRRGGGVNGFLIIGFDLFNDGKPGKRQVMA